MKEEKIRHCICILKIKPTVSSERPVTMCQQTQRRIAKYGTCLTPQGTVFLVNLVAEQQVKKFPEYYGRQMLACSPERCTGPHPEP